MPTIEQIIDSSGKIAGIFVILGVLISMAICIVSAYFEGE